MEQLIGVKIKCVTNLMRRRFANVFDANCDKMTAMHGWIIRFLIQQKGDTFQKDVEKKFNIRRSTATKLLQSMEKNGLITRQSVKTDARLKSILLTQKAKDLHKQVEEQISSTEKVLCKGISQTDQELVLATLQKMAQNLIDDSNGGDKCLDC